MNIGSLTVQRSLNAKTKSIKQNKTPNDNGNKHRMADATNTEQRH